MKPPILFAVSLAVSTPLGAEVTLAPIFGDHMVLQRESGAPIFGTAASGESVTVSFGDQKQSVKADDSGAWRVVLQDLKVGGPRELSVAGASNTITLNDVLVGEVWVGSGQSNMAGNVGGYAKNDPSLAAVLAAAPYPQIRLLKGGPKPTWMLADEKSIPGFSAILFAFGERLHRDLDVPVGLMVGAVGGTPSGQWLSEDAYEASGACAASLERARAKFDAAAAEKQYRAKLAQWVKAAAEAEANGEKPKGRKPNPPVVPGELPRGGKVGGLYERFIRTMVGYGIRGVLWDQGESGTGVLGVDQPSMMHALVTGWRKEWNQGEFPFLFVQKPSGGGCAFDPDNPITEKAEPYKTPPAEVPDPDTGGRLLYVELMGLVPNSFMIPACDLGAGIHPSNKWGYGNRASEIALAEIYGRNIVAYGPTYKSHSTKDGKLRIQFTHIGSGLTYAHAEKLTGFAIAGKDGVYRWADATIEGDSVILTSPDVHNPVHARYGASKSRPWANLFNREGQPALAFRTDKS